MIKLVIGFDEIPEAYDEVTGISCFWNFEKFLRDQFPQWDIELAFDLRTIEYDCDNREVSVEMRVT